MKLNNELQLNIIFIFYFLNNLINKDRLINLKKIMKKLKNIIYRHTLLSQIIQNENKI